MNPENNGLNYFSGAMPQVEFLRRCWGILSSKGFNRENTIVGVCVCREEPACFLVREIRKLWKTVYDFSSLAGMPFVGKTGFLKMQKYAPYGNDDTRFLYMAFSHIGWTVGGERGMFSPQGNEMPCSGCGGLIAFQRELVSGSAPWEPDPDNLEQGLLNQQMFRNMKYGGGSDLVALTKLAYSIILKDIERLVGLTLANQGNAYAMVTGIQLNGSDQQEWIWPGESYERICGQKKELSLM